MQFLKRSRFSMLSRSAYSQAASLRMNATIGSENILFIWIPKTAGTTIFSLLNEHLKMQKRKKKKYFLSFPNKGAVTFSHVSYLDLLEMGAVSQQYHDTAYKFSFVRDPYKRAVSLFNYSKQFHRISQDMEFERFLDEVYLRRPPIGLYNFVGLSQANPQVDWLIGSDGKLLVDDLFKVENLEKFAARIQEKYAVTLNLKTHLNKSRPALAFDDVAGNTSVIEKIETIYARDFDLLGYDRLGANPVETQVEIT